MNSIERGNHLERICIAMLLKEFDGAKPELLETKYDEYNHGIDFAIYCHSANYFVIGEVKSLKGSVRGEQLTKEWIRDRIAKRTVNYDDKMLKRIKSCLYNNGIIRYQTYRVDDSSNPYKILRASPQGELSWDDLIPGIESRISNLKKETNNVYQKISYEKDIKELSNIQDLIKNIQERCNKLLAPKKDLDNIRDELNKSYLLAKSKKQTIFNEKIEQQNRNKNYISEKLNKFYWKMKNNRINSEIFEEFKLLQNELKEIYLDKEEKTILFEKLNSYYQEMQNQRNIEQDTLKMQRKDNYRNFVAKINREISNLNYCSNGMADPINEIKAIQSSMRNYSFDKDDYESLKELINEFFEKLTYKNEEFRRRKQEDHQNYISTKIQNLEGVIRKKEMFIASQEEYIDKLQDEIYSIDREDWKEQRRERMYGIRQKIDSVYEEIRDIRYKIRELEDKF